MTTRTLTPTTPGPAITTGAPTPTSTPAEDSVAIGSLIDLRLRMNRPISLRIQRNQDQFTAVHDELDELGYGADPISAVQDFRQTLAELYWTLKEQQHRLGPDLARTWSLISDVIHEA